MSEFIKIKITDRFRIKHNNDLCFILNLVENNFPTDGHSYVIKNQKIIVDGINYIVTDFEKVRSSGPIEWDTLKPIGIIVSEL